MKNTFWLLFLGLFSFVACKNTDRISTAGCCTAKNANTLLACKLMPEELQERKTTVLASLKEKVIERKELSDGYAFRFKGEDDVLDELVEFIKTERQCCDFFIFNLSISGDKSEAWLQLSGVEGTKDFITEELGL